MSARAPSHPRPRPALRLVPDSRLPELSRAAEVLEIFAEAAAIVPAERRREPDAELP